MRRLILGDIKETNSAFEYYGSLRGQMVSASHLQ